MSLYFSVVIANAVPVYGFRRDGSVRSISSSVIRSPARAAVFDPARSRFVLARRSHRHAGPREAAWCRSILPAPSVGEA